MHKAIGWSITNFIHFLSVHVQKICALVQVERKGKGWQVEWANERGKKRKERGGEREN